VNNKYYFTLPTVTQGIQLPIEIKWDFEGRSDSIDEYQEEVVKEVIGVATDFEIARFSHKENQNGKTDINYEFRFSNGSTWVNSYLAEGFTSEEIYFYRNTFTKSFFKLDFYDTTDTKTQINYFTIIIPTQQGDFQTASISPLSPFNNVQIRKPKFKLDFVGDKEGFFIYWLRNTDYLNIKTFYMTAKFFDAKIGVFVKMMNTPQSNLPNAYQFRGEDKFYYKTVLDYSTRTYEVFDENDQRIGLTNPILWYEYNNPPQ
jgi:hypothetical protein